MFVCVFAKKFPPLASQSCCEVSRPRAVGEYEYRLLNSVLTYSLLTDVLLLLISPAYFPANKLNCMKVKEREGAKNSNL